MFKKLGLAIAAALMLLSPIAAEAQSPPFNATSISTLGGNCSTAAAVPYQTAAGLTLCTPGGSGTQVLSYNSGNPAWMTISGTGTVTSAALSMPAMFTVTGSPITTSGTLTATLASQTANTMFVAPNGSAGAPTFRAMVAADMPSAGVVSGGVITGTFPALTIGSSQVTSAMILNNTIVNGDIATNTIANTSLTQMAATTIKSNVTGALANAADNTINSVLQAQLGSTQGAVPYRDASGWTALAPVSNALLQSNGAAANPSWVTTVPANSVDSAAIVNGTIASTDIAAGGVATSNIATGAITTALLATPAASGASEVLIASNTVTAAASLPLTASLSSAYEYYTVVFTGVLPSTNLTTVCVQFGVGGTYNTTGYNNMFTTVSSTGAASNTGNTGQGGVCMMGAAVTTTASTGVDGKFEIYSPSNTARYKKITFQTDFTNGTDWFTTSGGGLYGTNTAAITDVRLIMSSGNISGTIYIYGHRPI